jgi:hypothetical protein
MERMRELARVSRASFYRHWEEREPQEAEMALRDAIEKVAAGQRFYGYRRVTAQRHKQGWEVGVKRVRRIMKEDNLLAIGRRKFVATSDAEHPFRVYPNLAQRLELTDIDQLWVADLTYVRLEREFVYLAVVLEEIDARPYSTFEQLQEHLENSSRRFTIPCACTLLWPTARRWSSSGA